MPSFRCWQMEDAGLIPGNFKSRDDVLTLLVHLGYLAYEEEAKEVWIPNLEIAGEFENSIEGKEWSAIAKILADSDALLEATLRRDAPAVARGIDAAHIEHTSILSYNDENSLSCVIALAYYSARKDYQLLRLQRTAVHDLSFKQTGRRLAEACPPYFSSACVPAAICFRSIHKHTRFGSIISALSRSEIPHT